MLGDPGRLRALEIFALVVAEGSFSAAARASGLTPSAISKTIARLEERVGAVLVLRSTRALTLTSEGRDLHLRVLEILAALHTAEREAGAGRTPAGPVHITTSASYAQHRLYPILPDLIAKYPQLSITVSQTDHVVDLIEAQADLAIRAGEMPSSALVARTLGASRRLVVAAPAYLDRVGMPQCLEDLAGCTLIGFAYRRKNKPWPFALNGEVMDLNADPRLQASDGEGVRHMALSGLGLARLARFTIEDDLKAGRLVEVLPSYNPGDLEPFHAVRLGIGSALPARIRVLLDYLARYGRVDQPSPRRDDA
ncbi:MAG: LysR family transcriptional regulator [Alphaproteobacteria bacterium]|nr:LysR family transcriptional regulator [Alphaproteobacteria bacterium]MBU1281270.1 LysR family transcriptional regulator [Alphaproteobacteria bacterium]MBU1571645.1 LysR family transcriptional regulator [Alphaproteobacteria bacterium]MBU1827873.1 LysR family transcriptional regulator [Alphaproteobacteria bacterium]MBU2076450.1 LysR family transcriptional regulator [Alphaproteobacteria bacterium]